MQPVLQAKAKSKTTDSTRGLLGWGSVVVGTHFLVVLWHVFLLVKVQPGFPALAIVALLLVNLVPIAGVAAFAKGARRLAAVAIVIPLGTGLIIGGYSHFLTSGADNVFRMPGGGLTLSFQVSAVLLAILEALGCWLGVRMYRRH